MEQLLTNIFKTGEYTKINIYDLANYFKEYYELNDYIQKVEFKSIKGDGLYLVNEKTLILDLNRILNSSYNQYKHIDELYNFNLERYYLINIIFTLLHEISHAEQVKLSDENVDDTLHKIVREGIELGRRSPDNLTLDEKILDFKFHDKLLTERNANINAYYKMYCLNDLDLLGIGELRYIIDRLNKYLSSGYYIYKNPCRTYYALRNKRDEYKQLDFNDKDYDLYTKLSWGFPVDKSIINNREKIKLLTKEEL